MVTPEYFETMGIPQRRGPTLTERDRQGSPVVGVINESMARQYFADVDPIGQRFSVGTLPDADSPFIEIVGIVGDVRQSFEGGANPEYNLPTPNTRFPFWPACIANVSLVVRSAGDPTALVPSIRAPLQEIDRDQPLVKIRTMEQAIGDTAAQPRLQMLLLAIFAAVACALALIGVTR